MTDAAIRPTVVLVHGAWADASSWRAVIRLLQQRGIDVVAVQNPTTSLDADVAATRLTSTASQGRSCSRAIAGRYRHQRSWQRPEGEGTGLCGSLRAGCRPVNGRSGAGACGPSRARRRRALRRALPEDEPGKLDRQRRAGSAGRRGPHPCGRPDPARARHLRGQGEDPAWKDRPCWYVLSDAGPRRCVDLQRALSTQLKARDRRAAGEPHVPHVPPRPLPGDPEAVAAVSAA